MDRCRAFVLALSSNLKNINWQRIAQDCIRTQQESRQNTVKPEIKPPSPEIEAHGLLFKGVCLKGFSVKQHHNRAAS